MNTQVIAPPEIVTQPLTLEPSDSRRLANLCGLLGQHLRQIEERLEIEIRHRGSEFELIGPSAKIRAGAELLRNLYITTEQNELTPDEVHLALQTSGIEQLMEQLDNAEAQVLNGELPATAARDRKSVV